MRKQIYQKWNEFYSHLSLRYLIWGAFTITSLISVVMIAFSFYGRFSGRLQKVVEEQNRVLIEQVNNEVTAKLRDAMKVSDSLYFSAIKDERKNPKAVEDAFQLLYDTNKDSVENIALFSTGGELIMASPAVALKENIHVTTEKWFQKALLKPENLHYSNPHIQNLFVHSDYAYPRVVSLSRFVRVNWQEEQQGGVLLIDIKYDWIKESLENASMNKNGYVYLIDRTGNLIYHPDQQLILDGLAQENHYAAADYIDGVHEEKFNGEKRLVTVKTIGYTGWKIVGVIPQQEIPMADIKNVLFMIAIAAVLMLGLSIINAFISRKVANPIDALEAYVKEIENGNLDIEIREQGCYEVRHLGKAMRRMCVRIRQLMDDIVREHEIQRKNELNILQSQINPHFLYNTLDIVIWMVENEKPDDAVHALTALARFFRIGLSKGKTIISVHDEIEHVKNYLTIQKMRYKHKFEYEIDVEDDVLQLSSLKLILQPMVENAISYGMEFMDGDGEIKISVYREDDTVVMEVTDNGPGIMPERLEEIRSGDIVSSKKGSGIGVKNVNERIQLYFGKSYGVFLESEPDEGTKVTIRQPAVLYDENMNTGLKGDRR